MLDNSLFRSILLLIYYCLTSNSTILFFQKNFKAIIIGTVVLTLFNNKLYKIQAVDENLNIYSTFINEDGLKISYRDYYLQVNYIIIFILFFFFGLETIQSSVLNTKTISITFVCALLKIYKRVEKYIQF